MERAGARACGRRCSRGGGSFDARAASARAVQLCSCAAGRLGAWSGVRHPLCGASAGPRSRKGSLCRRPRKETKGATGKGAVGPPHRRFRNPSRTGTEPQ